MRRVAQAIFVAILVILLSTLSAGCVYDELDMRMNQTDWKSTTTTDGTRSDTSSTVSTPVWGTESDWEKIQQLWQRLAIDVR